MSDNHTEERTPTLLERMGGVSGLVYASIPTIDAEAHPLPDQLHPDAATHRLIGERFAGTLRMLGGPR